MKKKEALFAVFIACLALLVVPFVRAVPCWDSSLSPPACAGNVDESIQEITGDSGARCNAPGTSEGSYIKSGEGSVVYKNCDCVPTLSPEDSSVTICALHYEVILVLEEGIEGSPVSESCTVSIPLLPADVGCIVYQKLPFFTFVNALVALVLISGIYLLLHFRVKK